MTEKVTEKVKKKKGEEKDQIFSDDKDEQPTVCTFFIFYFSPIFKSEIDIGNDPP